MSLSSFYKQKKDSIYDAALDIFAIAIVGLAFYSNWISSPHNPSTQPTTQPTTQPSSQPSNPTDSRRLPPSRIESALISNSEKVI